MKSSHLCLGLAICVLFNSIAYAKTCEIPIQTMNVAGLKVGQNIREFQKLHPSVKQVVLGGDSYHLEFADGVDAQIKKTGVTWIDHIAYDLDSEMITSFSLSFLDGPMASYETDLDLFKSRILKNFKVPKKAGCKRTINIFINVMIIELRFIRTMVLHIQPLGQQLWYLVKNRRYSNKKTPLI